MELSPSDSSFAEDALCIACSSGIAVSYGNSKDFVSTTV